MIGVKANQPKLREAIKSIISDRNNHSSCYSPMELNRGRQELRSITVSDCIDAISNDWVGLRQVVSVYRKVIEKGKTREETAYFISSRKGNAFLYDEGVRGHWAIENSLHWVKDVTFREDESKIRKGNAPEVISTIKNIAINIFRINGYKSMVSATRQVCNDIAKICKMIF